MSKRLATLDAELDLNKEEVVVIDEDENAVNEIETSIANSHQPQEESEVEIE